MLYKSYIAYNKVNRKIIKSYRYSGNFSRHAILLTNQIYNYEQSSTSWKQRRFRQCLMFL